jgi:hypothetical protein
MLEVGGVIIKVSLKVGGIFNDLAALVLSLTAALQNSPPVSWRQ